MSELSYSVQKLLLWFGWGISLVLTGSCASTATNESTPLENLPLETEHPALELVSTDVSTPRTVSAEAWRADLRFLATRMPEIHPNLFWRVSEDEFRQAVSDLELSLPRWTHQQIIVELARLASMIDGHTHLPLFQADVDFQLYPIRLYLFDDGLFVTDAEEEHKEFLGSRVIAIGDTDIADAINAVIPLVPHDNYMTERLLAPVYLIIPEVLQALGIISETALPGFVFELPDGRTTVEHFKPVSSDRYRDWTALFVELAGLPARSDADGFERRDEQFSYSLLDETGTLYLQYNLVQGRTASGVRLSDLIKEMEADLETHGLETVIVDIRHNPGGNVQTIVPLLRFLQGNDVVNRPGGLYVIIGRNTFSAATLFAVDLERNTDATFVGEPTGGRPNLYGDVVPITLPNSEIRVLVSTIYWERSDPEDQRDLIEPDIYASLSSSDYFNLHDPAMDAILSLTNGAEP